MISTADISVDLRSSCPFERDGEADAARIMKDAVLAFEAALAKADRRVRSDAGSDCIRGLMDAVGDSGVHSWLEACCNAGLLNAQDYLDLFGQKQKALAA